MTKKVNFMCTAFRDGFQSVYGARVLTPDFLPALEAARDAGIDYFEAGGGARAPGAPPPGAPRRQNTSSARHECSQF